MKNMTFFRKKMIVVCICLAFVLLNVGQVSAQFEYLSQYEALYPGCIDNQESPIYGGTYPQKWPKDLNLPEFPGGGDVQLTRFVFSNVEYPDVVDSITPGPTPDSDSIIYRPKGIVYVQVVVDRCGRPTRQEVVQSVNEAYDMEALRIMQNLPVFKPGAINGERVKVALLIPVYFTKNTLKKKVEEEYYNVDDYENW